MSSSSPRWKQLLVAFMIAAAALSAAGCDSDFEFPTIEIDG